MHSDTILATLWVISWQAASLAAVVWLVVRMQPNISARLRSVLWLLVLLKFCLPPLGYLSLPAAHPSAPPPPAAHLSIPVPMMQHPVQGATADTNAESAPPAGRAGLAQIRRVIFDTPELLLVLWVLGMVVMADIFTHRRRRLRAVLRAAQPAPVELQDALARADALMRLRRLPSLRLSSSVSTPVVVGVLRPTILLPVDLSSRCSMAEIFPMLLHELAHVKRGDLLVMWLGQIVQTIFFFHPVAWLVIRQLRELRELACDEMVLATETVSPRDYASGYLAALRLTNGTPRPQLALAMAEPFTVAQQRIQRMLQPLPAHPARHLWWLVGLLACCGLPTFLGCIAAHHRSTPASWPLPGGNAQHTGQATVRALGVKKILWTASLGGHVGDPVVGSDGLLYVTTSEGWLYALDTRTGHTCWRKSIVSLVARLVNKSRWYADRQGIPVSYAAMSGKNGMVYCGSPENRAVSAFDALTGQQQGIFKPHRQSAGPSDNAPLVAPNGAVYAVFFDVLTAFDRNSKRASWDFRSEWKDAHGTRCVASILGMPSIGRDGTLYINAGSLMALNPVDGAVRWKFKQGEDGFEDSPVVGADGTVYACGMNDSFYAVDGRTGKLKWMNTFGKEQIQRSPALDSGGTLYISSNYGLLHAVDSATGDERWRMPVNMGIFDAPLISADGKLFVAGCAPGPRKDYIYATVFEIDDKTGNILDTSPVLESGKSGGAGKLAIGPDGTLYTGTWNGHLFALQ